MSKLYTLQTRQELPLSLSQAWGFLSDPRNLSRITPRHMNFVIKSDLPPKAYSGLIIEYTKDS